MQSVRYRRLFVLIVGVALGAVAMHAILLNDMIVQLRGHYEPIHVPVEAPAEQSAAHQTFSRRPDGVSRANQPTPRATAVSLSGRAELLHAANMLERLAMRSKQVTAQERQREAR